MNKYLKRTSTHYVNTRREALENSPWAKFIAKSVLPKGTKYHDGVMEKEINYRYVCFEFIGDYQAYLFFRNEEYITL
jgi:hypothetical protein